MTSGPGERTGPLALTSVATSLLGLLVALGWITSRGWATTLLPGLDPTPFNAGVALALAGAGGLAVAAERRALALGLGGVVALVGVLALVQTGIGTPIGVDRLIFDAGDGSGLPLAPNTGLCLVLLGLGIGGMLIWRPPLGRLVPALLATGAGVIALVDLLGYRSRLVDDVGSVLQAQMSLAAAVAVLLLAAGLFLYTWRGPDGLALMPILRLPLLAGVVAAVLSVTLAQLLRAHERSQIREMVRVAAHSLAGRVERHFEQRTGMVRTLGALWPATVPARWEPAAAGALRGIPGGVAIGWVPPAGSPRWLAGDGSTVGWWPPAANGDSVTLFTRRRGPEARLGLLAPVPQGVGGTGALWVVTDLSQGLRAELRMATPGYELVVRDGAGVLMQRTRDRGPLNHFWGEEAVATVAPRPLTVRIWPTAGTLAAARSRVPIMALTTGMAVAVLLGMSLALARLAAARAREMATAHDQLTREMREREAAEAALRSSADQLRQAQKLEAVGRLAGGIAHDYNNLITVIRGNARTLLLQGGLTELARDAVEHIDRAAGRGALLTARLLSFSQRQLLQPEPLRLEALLQGLHDELAQLLGPHVELVQEPVTTADGVEVDRRWLTQVVLDLGFNAREAMPLGGRVTLRVLPAEAALRAQYGVTLAAPRAVVLEIEDAGRGMDDATRRRLFEPFFSTKRFGQGSGLALASAYGIVRQSGGEIAVQSVPERGTRVGIFLPLATMASVPPAPAPLSGVTVVVAEDEPGVLRLLRRTLEAAGCQVVGGPSAEAALEELERSGRTPALLVSDIVMPGRSGVELAADLQERYPGLPVLFVSAYTSDALAERGIASLGAYLLAKPFTSEELLAQAARALGQRSAGSPPRSVPAR